ncbi:MAG TPA: molecular chaperone DnaK [bacterium]|nr:molecular chaperone DnaK [bacterium]
MERVIGIDLGTTYSCVAVMERGQPVVIPNKGGYKTTPSIVAVTDTGKRLVGHIARRQMITNARNTIFASKRLIGRKFDAPEVKRTIETAAYEVAEGPHGDVRVKLGDKVYSLPEISAMILLEMKKIASEYLGEEVKKAVITVPAYFNDSQRQATKDAGKIAGLDVLRIINEPTAASLAYGYGKELEQTICSYDLGGGTFDISILEIGVGVFEVISTAGDTFLGGEDFDRRIIDFLSQEFYQKHQIDLRQDRMALQRLKDAAETAKRELSTSMSTEVSLPFIASDGSGSLHLNSTLTRQKFDELVGDLVERTIQICDATLKAAQLEKKDIDAVILVGGQTRSPIVQRRVGEFFGREPSKGVHPDEVVAIGAAIQGAALLQEKSDMLLLDVTPLSLGIVTVGGFFKKLIEKNTTVPCQKSEVFTTAHDNQTAVKIRVMQGESNKAEENELLGEFLLTGIRKAPRGEPTIDVTFSIDSDGIVNVSARDRDTGKEQGITVTATSGLTDEEINKMAEDAARFEVAVKQEESVEASRQRVEVLMHEIEKILPRLGGNDAALSMARGAIEANRQIAKTGNPAQAMRAAEELTRVLNSLRAVG